MVVPPSAEAAWAGQRFVCIGGPGEGWEQDAGARQGERCEVRQLPRAPRGHSTCVQSEERSVKLDRLGREHDKNSA